MPKQENLVVRELLTSRPDGVVQGWLKEAQATGGPRSASVTQSLSSEAEEMVKALAVALQSDEDAGDFNGNAWQRLRDALENTSKSGAARGNTAADTASFVLALKRPLFEGVQERLTEPKALASATWALSTLVDKMAQMTLMSYQRTREEIIRRQQEELLELSTPVIKLWEGVLAVPMIGTLDSTRTQLVMESLLQRIVETGSEMAIIDITGVPTVDTLVAQHLLKTVTAIRLMGADCIISGIRPQIAQTIVQLGIDLKGISTKASLADALSLALKRSGYVVSRPA